MLYKSKLRGYFYTGLASLIFVTSCSNGDNISSTRNHLSSNASSTEEMSQLEKIVNNNMKTDENGKPINLKGFVASEKLQSGNDTSMRAAYENKSMNIFTYEPPEGMDADFSEPIMTNAAFLYLAGSDDTPSCSALNYQDTEPTIAQIIDKSKANNLCGSVKVSFCLRFSFLSSGSEADVKNYIYAQSPELNLYMPCPEKIFANISLSINEASLLNQPSTADIDITAGSLISKMYLTNASDCNSQGVWEPTVSKKKAWPLLWQDDKATTKVYAKFQEIIFDTVSECFESSYSDTVKPSTPAQILNLASTLTTASFSWAPSSDAVTGLAFYEVSIGSAPGASDVKPYTKVGTALGHSFTGLSLSLGSSYYANVRAIDTAGNVSDAVSSPGFKAQSSSLNAQQNHVCAILSGSNQLKCWGLNSNAQLGLGDLDNRGDGPNEMGSNLATIALGTGRTAVAVGVGEVHTCALLDDTSVKCWGLQNNVGRLGTETVAGKIGDSLSEMGDHLVPVNFGSGRHAVQLAVGNDHTCALLDNGSVKCFGLNGSGQLGLGDTGARGNVAGTMGDELPAVNLGSARTALQVAAGKYFSCALLDTGAVKCWGQNTNGQLGLGDRLTRGNEPGQMGDRLPAVDLGPGNTAIQIAASRDHTCALLSSGNVKCWGENDAGQAGLGNLLTYGDNPGEMGASLPLVKLGTGLSATRLGLGFRFSCALLSSGSLKCWGANEAGQLGYGDTLQRGSSSETLGEQLPTINLGSGLSALQITAGNTFACAALNDGSIKCWGDNTYGQLGQGTTTDSSLPQLVPH